MRYNRLILRDEEREEDDKSADGNGVCQIVPAYAHRMGRIHAGFALAWHLQWARLPAWLCGE